MAHRNNSSNSPYNMASLHRRIVGMGQQIAAAPTADKPSPTSVITRKPVATNAPGIAQPNRALLPSTSSLKPTPVPSSISPSQELGDDYDIDLAIAVSLSESVGPNGKMEVDVASVNLRDSRTEPGMNKRKRQSAEEVGTDTDPYCKYPVVYSNVKSDKEKEIEEESEGTEQKPVNVEECENHARELKRRRSSSDPLSIGESNTAHPSAFAQQQSSPSPSPSPSSSPSISRARIDSNPELRETLSLMHRMLLDREQASTGVQEQLKTIQETAQAQSRQIESIEQQFTAQANKVATIDDAFNLSIQENRDSTSGLIARLKQLEETLIDNARKAQDKEDDLQQERARFERRLSQLEKEKKEMNARVEAAESEMRRLHAEVTPLGSERCCLM